MEEFAIDVVNRGVREGKLITLTEEVPLTVEVNGKELATLLSSPEYLKDLVIGFLYTSGLINSVSAVRSLIIDEERWKAQAEIIEEGLPEELVFKRIYTSGCGRGVLFHNPLDLIQRIRMTSDLTVSADRVMEMMRVFLNYSGEYKNTRGVHSAALVSVEGIEVFRDDLGRHNALDKVIGHALTQGISFADKMMFTSGRISSEIISKVMRARIPIVVSSGAPTNQAVKLAREIKLTVLAFVRGGHVSIFSAGERVVL